MIIINFKNYKFGNEALNLAKKIKKYLPKAIICPATADIWQISQNTKLAVYAQHVSSLEGNRNTGFDLPESIKSAGASGTLLNHSEHKIPFSQIKKSLAKLSKLKLKVIVCVSSLREAKKISRFHIKPYAIAFEDPKLISTGKSITQYNPKTIKKFVKILGNKNIIQLCGAGINSTQDVIKAKLFGCKGVLIASAIANSKNPVPLLKKIKKFY